jgi:hypothetical protein
MKSLSPDEIECLLEVRPSKAHPLDILGYGYSSEGARLFRAERPDFLPQIAGYIRSVLARSGVFPEGINRENAGFRAFLYPQASAFWLSRVKAVGLGRYERIVSGPMSEREAITDYIQSVANPDYIDWRQPMDWLGQA